MLALPELPELPELFAALGTEGMGGRELDSKTLCSESSEMINSFESFNFTCFYMFSWIISGVDWYGLALNLDLECHKMYQRDVSRTLEARSTSIGTFHVKPGVTWEGRLNL